MSANVKEDKSMGYSERGTQPGMNNERMVVLGCGGEAGEINGGLEEP